MIREKQYADVALIDKLNAEAWGLRETDMRKAYEQVNECTRELNTAYAEFKK